MNYRYDLDLLKGYCILLIILYHYNVKLFLYGYVGVVVFINISGYLSMYNVNTNILRCIIHRYLRITPSYYILVLITLSFLLDQNIVNENDIHELKYLFLYIYNFRLIHSENDYFAKESKSLFNHLWYVSVIMQMYIIKEIVSSLRNKAYCSYIIITILSFSFNFYDTFFVYSNANYYNTLTRLWYYLLPYLKINFSININFSIIIILFLSIYKIENIFINVVIISFISTMVCLNKNAINILSNCYNRVIINIGSISYSLYLYHYLLVNNSNNVMFKVLLSFLFSITNQFIVEKYIKHKLILLSTLYIISLFIVINKIKYSIQNKSYDLNVNIIKDAIKYSSKLWCSHCHCNPCHFNNSILLVGDSHLEQWIPAMLNYTKSYGIELHYFYYHLKRNNYNILYEKYFSGKKDKWILIILGFFTSKIYNDNLIKKYITHIIKYFLEFTRNILYIEDSPTLTESNICLKCYDKKHKSCYMIKGVNVTIYPKIIEKMDRVKYISLNNIICMNRICPCMHNKISVYDTMSHLSPLYTKQFYFFFNKIFNDIVNVSVYKDYNSRKSACNFYVHGTYFYRSC